MKNLFLTKYDSLLAYSKAHKIKASVLIILVLLAGYWIFKTTSSVSGEVRYVTGNVSTSTIVSTVSASGQVSASNKVDIKPKVSGDITWLNVKAGDKVRSGQALMGIDNTDAKRSLIEAQQSYETSKLQYQKDSASAPMDYQKTLDSLNSAKEDLDNTYSDTFNTLSNAYLDLPTVVTSSQNILYGNDLNPTGGQWNYNVFLSMFNDENDKAKIKLFADKADSDYKAARADYDKNVLIYKQTTRLSSDTDLENILSKTINTTTLVAQTLQSELNLLSAVIDTAQTYNYKLPSAVTTMQTTARNNLSTINSDLSNLLSQKKAIDTAKQNIKTYEQNVALLKVGNDNGDNPISLQISKNNLDAQAEKISQLKQDLQDYTIIAPFNGTVSAVNVKVGDPASGALATVITDNQIAELSLNEVDAAKVKIGDKVTLTFDAIDGLSISGVVAEKDTVGTVTSGVVSYTIKISFDVQDDRVSPGMTVNASIQTGVSQNTLVVPSSAVKTKNGVSYVQVFNPPVTDVSGSTGFTSKVLPTQVEVKTGLSNDTEVEILSGLSVGDQIVTKTISGAVTTKTATTRNATNLTGSTRSTGAAVIQGGPGIGF